MNKVYTILNRQENSTEDLIYVVEHYIKDRKNTNIKIDLDKYNPTHSLNIMYPHIHQEQLQLLDVAFRTAAHWYWQNEVTYNK